MAKKIDIIRKIYEADYLDTDQKILMINEIKEMSLSKFLTEESVKQALSQSAKCRTKCQAMRDKQYEKINKTMKVKGANMKSGRLYTQGQLAKEKVAMAYRKCLLSCINKLGKHKVADAGVLDKKLF